MSENLDETILNYIEIFIKENPEIYSSEKFSTIVFNSVYELLSLTLGSIIDVNTQHFTDTVSENIAYYFNTCGIPRSYDNSCILSAVEVL